MPVEFGVKSHSANLKVNDIRPPLRAAVDDLSTAISAAYAAVDVLGSKLEPVLGPMSEGSEDGCRPSYGAPLLEETHQLVDRVNGLAATIRAVTDRLVL